MKSINVQNALATGNATTTTGAVPKTIAAPNPPIKPDVQASSALTTAQGKLDLLTAQRAADTQLAAFVIAAVALNLIVLSVLRRILSAVSSGEALAEKDPIVIEQTTTALVASHKLDLQVALDLQAAAAAAGQVGGNPLVVSPITAKDVADALPASYSRVAGALGAIILAAALYAIANYVVWAAFFASDKVTPVLQNIGSFFLAGSALFAPYAFNQLTTVFPKRP